MELAKLSQRIRAQLIDWVLLIVAFLILSWIFKLIGAILYVVFVMSWLFIYLLYFILLEYHYGQTIGKKIMNITVLSMNGKQISLKQSFIRNILRLVDMLPFLYLLGIILILSAEKKQRLGDMLAKTIVVSFT